MYNRTKTGIFKKGYSGNPNGRPKKKKEFVQYCKEMTEEILKKLIHVIEFGKDTDAIKAIEIVLAYGYGKPDSKSKVELTGADGGAIKVKWID